MRILYQILGTILILYFGVSSVVYLQNRFDKSDLNKAADFIYEFKPNPQNGKNLMELMAQDLKKPVSEVFCESQILSRTEGTVLVSCYPKSSSQDQMMQSRYEWVIHLVSYLVSPNNVRAKLLLANQGKSNGQN